MANSLMQGRTNTSERSTQSWLYTYSTITDTLLKIYPGRVAGLNWMEANMAVRLVKCADLSSVQFEQLKNYIYDCGSDKTYLIERLAEFLSGPTDDYVHKLANTVRQSQNNTEGSGYNQPKSNPIEEATSELDDDDPDDDETVDEPDDEDIVQLKPLTTASRNEHVFDKVSKRYMDPYEYERVVLERIQQLPKYLRFKIMNDFNKLQSLQRKGKIPSNYGIDPTLIAMPKVPKMKGLRAVSTHGPQLPDEIDEKPIITQYDAHWRQLVKKDTGVDPGEVLYSSTSSGTGIGKRLFAMADAYDKKRHKKIYKRY